MPKRIQFVVNNAQFFVSHRLPIALAAREAGYEVNLVTGQAGSAALEPVARVTLAERSIAHAVTAFRSDGTNILREAQGLAGVWRAVSTFSPDIVHAVSPKGILYGGLCARGLRVPALVIAISGMGSLFTKGAKGVRAALRRAYSAAVSIVYAHPRKRVIVQNMDDAAAVMSAGWARPDEITLIPGSGVDLSDYPSPHQQPDPQNVVILPARLLREKGLPEFVEAARRLRARGALVRMVLVGTADYRNPSAVPEHEIRAWVDQGAIEWWGHQEDMPAIYRKAAIVCLPSYYGEGMPKCLLEAAAAGRPVVTTDVTGCRDAVIPGETGDLVPARDAQALADALEALINDSGRRTRYGLAGRELAVRRYSIESVIETTMTVYERLLAT